MGRECSTHRRADKCIQIMVEIPEKRPLRWHDSRWEDNIEIRIEETGCGLDSSD